MTEPLPEFQWAREESWMTIEAAGRPAIREMLLEQVTAKLSGDPPDIAAIDAAVDEVIIRLRSAFDKAWTEPIQVTIPAVDIRLADPTSPLQIAIDNAVREQREGLVGAVSQWCQRRFSDTLTEFARYEIKILMLESPGLGL